MKEFWAFYVIDHAALRSVWTNLFEIAPGVWRSNHPSPRRIGRYARMGITTVLNLRGEKANVRYIKEEYACRHASITLVTIPLSARNAGRKEAYLALLDQFDTVARPFVIHCKSGADRTGLAAAFFLLHEMKVPVSVARRQLSLRYAHVRFFKTGVLDLILETYEADIQRLGNIELREWLTLHYDRNAIETAFNATTLTERFRSWLRS
jgi:protein tyrosine/serine phosphatase